MRYYTFEKERNPQLAADALKQALVSLDKMIEGGIYDQIGEVLPAIQPTLNGWPLILKKCCMITHCS
ncbi:hypothetical protein LWM68_35760 [Niabella sp. W65]|nr:hypothetical protein [Niabella sp. W65]MCH7367645.1 hypothetical protein [Niabella sp. W65]